MKRTTELNIRTEITEVWTITPMAAVVAASACPFCGERSPGRTIEHGRDEREVRREIESGSDSGDTTA